MFCQMKKIQHKGGTPAEGLEDQKRKFAFWVSLIHQGVTHFLIQYLFSVTSYFPNVSYSYLIVCNSLNLGAYFDFFMGWLKSNQFLLNETKTQNILFNLKQIDTTNLQIDYSLCIRMMKCLGIYLV